MIELRSERFSDHITQSNCTPPLLPSYGMEHFVMANATVAKASSIQPRFIRFGDAPGYLGTCVDELTKLYGRMSVNSYRQACARSPRT